MMNHTPPVAVQAFGQSVWLDYIHREELRSGELQRRIDEDGVVGVTSNPSIFQKAIGDSDVYDSAIQNILDLDAEDIYERLAVEDIQAATDLFRPIYERTDGIDGYVSLEVSPLIADSTEQTIAEARRLFDLVDRPNLMIKIPATDAGIPAIEASIADGINVNVTLIFSVENYVEVAEAFIRGLEKRLQRGDSVAGIASVASFFLSRIDSMVDKMLQNNIAAAQFRGDTELISANRKLFGQAAVANAKLAYREYQRMFEGERFAELQAAGAQVQRPLWASTSTKNPAYPDTKYVDNIIGKNTVNTLPPKTLDAFKDHGTVALTITTVTEEHLDPDYVMDMLAELNVDMQQVTHRLQVDGVESFIEAFEKMINQVAGKRAILHTGIVKNQDVALGIHADAYTKALDEADHMQMNARIWNHDGSLWKDNPTDITKIENRLGWTQTQDTIDIDRLKTLQESISNSGMTHVVLLGMGGSSLAPEVFMKTFGSADGYPDLLVLDSTNPDRIVDVEATVELDNTLFVVASKSGGTIETLSFYRYFYERTNQNGQQFIAITDADSQLEAEAKANNFRDVFINPTDIGGRYSALSYFGLVPAAMIGIDLDRIADSADRMLQACGSNIPAKLHPGITLGILMGILAKEGRDKVCVFCTESIASFGNWVEQLVAESTGKEGRGIIPVVGTTVGMPHDYASDRVFIYLRVEGDADVAQMDEQVKALREAGHPRITVYLPDVYALSGEFFRWEYATAVAGQLLSVNPFDEPNVTEAKEATKALLEHYEAQGALPTSTPIMQADGVQMFAAEQTIEPLRELCRAHGYDNNKLIDVLAAQMTAVQSGDYFALLAYLNPTPELDAQFKDIQRRLRHATHRAVTVGFGPRYLHSTGQLHKGGAGKGVFIQITTDPENTLAIPQANYDFGTLFAAQAAGDFEALNQHGLRTIRLHIQDIEDGISILTQAIGVVQERRR